MTKNIYLPLDDNFLPLKILKTSGLHCVYERGNLRYIKYGSMNVVSLIYTAVRDQDWHTAPFEIEDEKIEEKEGVFDISYRAIYRLNDIHYKAAICIQVGANVISFSMKGEALSTFKRNRVGICVLHSLKQFVNTEVIVTTPDESRYLAKLPEFISPNQVLMNIKQMQFGIDEKNTAQLNFEGDIFEMEDQRNWGDNTYKTYGTPLAIPLPVDVKTGETMEQKIILTIISKALPVVQKPAPLLHKKYSFPKIGYNRVKGQLLTDELIVLLQALPFDHYRVELQLFSNDWKDELNNAVIEAVKLSTQLELVVFFSDSFEKEAVSLVKEIENVHDLIKSILPLHNKYDVTPPVLLEKLYPVLKGISSTLQVGYGTDGAYAELHRNPPISLKCDFISYSLNPQGHVTDTRSLIENLDTQKHQLRTLKELIGNNVEVHVSPITFKMRTLRERYIDNNPGDYDERQHSDFGAAWTLLTIRNLAEAQLSFYDTTGYKGIIADDYKTRNELSPLYKMLAEIKAFAPIWISQSNIDNNLNVILENAEGNELIYHIDSKFNGYISEI